MLYSMAATPDAAAILCNAAVNRMTDPGQNAVNREQRVFRGYMVGVLSGTAFFWIAAFIVGVIYEITTGNWGIIHVGLWYMTIVIPIAICISLLTSPFLVAIPFIGIYRVAKLMKIKNVIYYVISGAITALFFFSLWLAHVRNYWNYPPPPFWPNIAAPLIGALFGGASGAFIFWWIAVRERHEQTLPGSNHGKSTEGVLR
jgi:hypothetical protein